MSTSIISSKYQIVIPKEIRKKLGIIAGQRVYLSTAGDEEIVIKTTSDVEPYIGILSAGSEDPITYQRHIRKDKKYL